MSIFLLPNLVQVELRTESESIQPVQIIWVGLNSKENYGIWTGPNSIPRWKNFSGVSFLLLMYYNINHHIFNYIASVSLWWVCLVVSRLHSKDAGVSGLLFSDFLWFFLGFILSSKQPIKNQETHPMLIEKKVDGLSAV